MKITVVKDYKTLSKLAAEQLAEFIRNNNNASICLPTGGSVIGCYEELLKINEKDNIDFTNIKSYNMDEYVPLKPTDENSYYYFLNERLYKHLNIRKENTFAPEVYKEDLEKVAKEYTDKIRNADIDYILLGIGTDGHIAFNMPNKTLAVDTHLEDLSKETIKANSRYFDSMNDVPKQAMTIGIGIILKSSKIVLVASGKAKARAIADFVNNRKLNNQNPASYLWLHNDVTLILDENAASEIN